MSKYQQSNLFKYQGLHKLFSNIFQECECKNQVECTGVTNWIGDNFCDDENNNYLCQYDGGDCCNNSKPNWDFYCTVSIFVS